MASVKKGRPNKYIENVKPRFDEIVEWLQLGATEKEIAENLGVNQKVFCKYKKDYPELNDLIKKGRKKPVQDIKAALFKRATGFQYSESKLIEDDEGHWKKETFTKTALPDPASAMILLKHWDKEGGWTNDPAALELKKKEYELKKQHMESEDW
jgi:hypothetical protein